MRAFTPLSLLAFVALLVLLPLLFGEVMAASLIKLHLTPGAALVVTLAIIVGGAINIPVKRVQHEQEVTLHPLAIFGLDAAWPQLRRQRTETVIAVNIGGCIIPAALALYELAYLSALGGSALLAVVLASGINIVLCHALARPVPGVGILIPGIVPAFGAAILALMLMPSDASPVAFVAGVAGPLIGADLLHLREIEASPTGIASIGGAGTFDGIVLSGIVAAYLA